MSGLELFVALIIITAGAALQGSVGFGQNLLAAPLVALVEPEVVPGALLVAATAINVLVLVRERSDVDIGEVAWSLGGRLPGVILGAAAVSALSTDGLGIVLGSLVLTAVVLTAAGLHIPRTPATRFGAGMVSGFGATSIGIGGPPMALLYADVEGGRLRSTLAGYFFFGTLVSIGALAVIGEFGRRDLELGIPLVPGVVVGFLVSSRLTPILDRGYTKPVVLSLSAVVAVTVLLRSLL